MKPERWQKITDLFEAALPLPPEERAAFVAQNCGGDEELRREVEAMLRSHEEEPDFIEEPAAVLAARQGGDGASLVGQAVAHFQVLSCLGSGGMGDVYLARDTRLGRKVALKLLPDYLAGDVQRVRRFEQEARTASALSHPNIVTVYDVGRHEGRHFIATEHVAGETLRARLARSRPVLTEVLDVAAQVADALVAAHAAGIIHRDIKPENLMIRRDRLIKVLDFGLAKLTETEARAADTQAPTNVMVNTEPGMLLGTVGYMSPEQARGLAVDARTDIWSLGVILYEMAAGRVAFEGGTPADTLSLILQKEPAPLARFAPEAPEELARIVTKALAKDPEERYQTAKDLLIDLRRLRRELSTEAEPERPAQPDDSAGDAGGGRGATAAESGRPTGAAAHLQTASSAEYLVGEVKRHKRGVLLAAALAVAAVAVYFYATRGGREINSLAVLPLVNAGGNPDTEYLSDGITESLIDSLSQLPKLRVMSLNSVLRYKGRELDAQAVGRELGVEAVVTGRVVQRGDGLVVSVEMLDVRDNSRLWGSRYDRKLSDLLAVQGEISREVLEKLRLRLTGEEEKRATKRYTENTEAYQLYLKGRYHWNRRAFDDILKGLEHFQQAIQLDPNYALAYSGVADSYFAMVFGGPFGQNVQRPMTPAEAKTKSLAAARRAVELDPNLAEAHTSLAEGLEWFEWDYAGAEREYQRALELNPDYATAHHRRGLFLVTTGRLDEGFAELKHAQQLDPASLPINADLGFYYCNAARQYDQGIEQLKKTIELEPNWPRAHFLLGTCYSQKGMYDEALREMQKTTGPVALAVVYVRTGRRDEALKILAEMKERSKRQYVAPLAIANLYLALGDKEQTFEWLEKAYAERQPNLRALKMAPAYDELRSDPRFADLLRRMGLPP